MLVESCESRENSYPLCFEKTAMVDDYKSYWFYDRVADDFIGVMCEIFLDLDSLDFRNNEMMMSEDGYH